jgi:DNA-binding CsgD family transcriptional regulator
MSSPTSRTLDDLLNQPELLGQLEGLVNSIREAKSPAGLPMTLVQLNAMFDLSGSVFTSFTREDETFDSYRYVVACPPEWCNEYNARRWYAIDPCLIYAQNNAAPALIADIDIRTQGQRSLMDAARNFGFVSGAVFPAHSPHGRSRMGVLYMASRREGFFDRQGLNRSKYLLRSFAAELLDWWTAKIRADLLGQVQLSALELKLLRMESDGYSTKEIASQLELTASAIDARFRRIAIRFGEHSRAAAARKALDHGLLDKA